MVLAMTSCSYTTVAPAMEATYEIDFQKYSENGFFITASNTVPFDYIPLGIVETTVRAGENRNEQENLSGRLSYEDFYGIKHKVAEAEYPIKSYSVYDAIDILEKAVRSKGGDGIMMFTSKIIPPKTSDNKIYLHECTVSGMAFKRKTAK